MPVEDNLYKLQQEHIVEMFTFDFKPIGVNFVARFTNEEQNISFQGVTYQAIPIKITDVSITSNKPASPTLYISNVTGTVTALVLAYSDLRGVKLIRRRTLAKHLDGGSEADPWSFYPEDVFYISRKSKEDALEVTFEMVAMINRALKVQIPKRAIYHNSCEWIYRSSECGYTGGAVADENDKPTNLLANDRCGKRINSCKLRFGNDLPFGGFPGVDAYDI